MTDFPIDVPADPEVDEPVEAPRIRPPAVLVCSGPGPHDPPDGILGELDMPGARGEVTMPGTVCSSPACRPPEDPAVTGARALTDRLAKAGAANRAYLALSPPTAAQTTAQVKALTRQTNALIRLALGDPADTSDT